ncbi:protein PSK SIMULATOR 1-like [Zingiber officinale]|uniref:protein PSK SIMULATOR 1-like n=1 Tax=Zingiber officinale TaxID=94328 RepID=UPI001C4D9AE6|nr:protein PSK SIMULATOR 1-like [Zingiber officinale]
MGCVCSRQIRKDTEATKGELYGDRVVEVGFRGDRKTNYKIFDSGELLVLPAKAVTGKVSESTSILGRASIAGLEKAVEVLDTLGSSMSNLNPSSGFTSGIPSRGNRISILAFEVANTIAKGANLWRSLSDENINTLKVEILQSDGVRKLISEDANELICIAALDKREELDLFSREVIRFGDLCKDPMWHNLGRYFEKFSMDTTSVEQSKMEVETTMQNLINLAQNTSYLSIPCLQCYFSHQKFCNEVDSDMFLEHQEIPFSFFGPLCSTELYHELHALDRYEQDCRRKLQEEELIPASKQGSNLLNHKEALNGSLGSYGLALHYANIINHIDNIVSRPLSLPPTTRDSLYQGLPIRVKATLRARILSSDAKEEYTVPHVKAEMQKILRWLTPIAQNTISIEINQKQDMQDCIIRIQTLHYANKEKTEDYILELVVWLHHLITQVKSRGFRLKSVDTVQSQSQTMAFRETAQDLSQEYKGQVDNLNFLSEEMKLLEQVLHMYETEQREEPSIRLASVYKGNSSRRMILISFNLLNENNVVIMVTEYDHLIGSAHYCSCRAISLDSQLSNERTWQFIPSVSSIPFPLHITRIRIKRR